MEWFVKNGLIFQLSTLFNSSSCTITMCRYFIIILNQIASDGTFKLYSTLFYRISY